MTKKILSAIYLMVLMWLGIGFLSSLFYEFLKQMNLQANWMLFFESTFIIALLASMILALHYFFLTDRFR